VTYGLSGAVTATIFESMTSPYLVGVFKFELVEVVGDAFVERLQADEAGHHAQDGGALGSI
jgi:hypothetical protein